MSILGIGIHVIIAIFFAIHALRSGQQLFWLFILFSFPLLGSLVYFIVIYLPDSRIESGAKKAVAVAAKALDPTRELREARAEFEYSGTVKNRTRFAAALLEAGRAEEAAEHYEACLKGPFATDPVIRFGAARCFVECGQYAPAIAHLTAIRADDPAFRAEQLAILLGRAYAGLDDNTAAQTEFALAAEQFGSFESLVQYAIWALRSGDLDTATRLKVAIDESMVRWNRHTRELNKPLLKQLYDAYAAAKK